jgi:WD40 repeat protein
MRKIINLGGDGLALLAGSVVLIVRGDDLNRLEMPSMTSDSDCKVLTLAASPCGKYLLVSYSDKAVVCWNIPSNQVVATGTLAKKACGMACGFVRGQYILCVVDKQGDIHCANALKLDSWVLMGGHTASVITDMQIIQEGSLLATADRDEKIRLSQFPELFHITGYCMGHTSVVSSLCEAITPSSRRLLVSGGWEHKLCVWDVSEGKLVSSTCVSSSDEKESKKEEKGKEEVRSVAAEKKDGGVGDDEGGGDEKTYDANAAGAFPHKVRSIQVGGQTGDYVLVAFNESPLLHVYSLSNGGRLSLKAAHRACAPVVDLASMAGGVVVLLLSGSHHVEVLNLTASSSQNITIASGQSSKVMADLMAACGAQKVDYGKQQDRVLEGGAGHHMGGSAVKEKHVIKRSFHAMIRGEPGTLQKKTREAAPRSR